MQIAKPQVHLKLDDDTFHIHVVTWFDQTKFISDGYSSISTTATDGVFTVVLKVKESSTIPNMTLLTPVVHTLTLTGVELDETNPFLEVIVINTSDDNAQMGKRKTHQADADASGMPEPKPIPHLNSK